MKRKLLNHNHSSSETKKSKITLNNLFPNDIIFEILKFIQFKQVIKTCFLISKQWHHVASTRHLFTDVVFVDQEAWDKIDNVPYIENIIGIKFGIVVKEEHVEHIKKFKQITDLNISGIIGKNEKDSDGNEGTMISDILTSSPKLVKLDISLNGKIGENVFQSIASLQNLTYLDLSSNYVDVNLFEILSEGDHLCQTLTDLNVADNCFSLSDDLDGLSKFTKMKNLAISSNGLSDNAYSQISVLKNLTSLSVANLSEFSKPLLTCLSRLLNLKELDISVNLCKDYGVSLLAESIKNSSITYLNLKGNEITDEGIFILCKSFPKLESLLIGNNLFSSAGLESIYATYGNQLTFFDIVLSDIDDQQLEIIANSMKKLKYINLGFNSLTDNSIPTLIQMQTFLKLINVDRNRFTSHGKQRLKELRRHCY